MNTTETLRLLKQHKRTFNDVPEIVETTNNAIKCVSAMEEYCNHHKCSECWFDRNNIICGR